MDAATAAASSGVEQLRQLNAMEPNGVPSQEIRDLAQLFETGAQRCRELRGKVIAGQAMEQ